MLHCIHQKEWAEWKNSDNHKKNRLQDAMPEQCPESFVPLESKTFWTFKDHHTLQKEPLLFEQTNLNKADFVETQPMSRAEQRMKKKMKPSNNSTITDKDIQKGLSIADRHNDMMQLQADVQIAMLMKNIDAEYFKQLTEDIRERRDKLRMENKKKNTININNSSSSMDNNSSDSDN